MNLLQKLMFLCQCALPVPGYPLLTMVPQATFVLGDLYNFASMKSLAPKISNIRAFGHPAIILSVQLCNVSISAVIKI